MLGIAIVISLGVMLLGAIIMTLTFWFEVLFGVDFDRELNFGLALVMAGLLLLALTAFLHILSVF